MNDFKTDIQYNIQLLKSQLRIDSNFDILYRNVIIGEQEAGFFFIDGFVQEDMVEKLIQFFYSLKKTDVENIDTFLKVGMPYTEVEKTNDLEQVITAFLSGVSVMFIDGFDECILLDCRTYPMRSVTEPWKDRVLRGSRDGFVETLVSNAALLRRRIRDTNFSMKMYNVGKRSRSDVAICYIDDLVDKKLLTRITNIVTNLEVESLTMNLESLAECMFQHRWIDPFPKFKYSERPDTAAAAILDGNIVIMIDNSPAVMIVPTSIFDLVEEPDDYNFAPLIGTYLRLSRFIFTFVTMLLTPVWILLVQNPHWIPQWLNFITVSDDITVPLIWQLLILELAVDGLKMAAVNTPTLLSTPLSIVAGIVVGEYAVSSGWFNTETLLYMAVVTVGTYSQASFEMGYAMKFIRVLTLCLTAIFNVYGFVIGIAIGLFSIIFNKTISGKSYIYPLVPFDANKLKRSIFRVRLPHSNNNKH
ncbi:MAG: spore germination protein [Lachnospira sp.]|jgi:stage V sporulation protein AF|nr:spore germination protein [Lachnospira sp.]